MKNFVLIFVLLFFLSGYENCMATTGQDDPPPGKKRIKIVTIDNGVTTVTDTLFNETEPGTFLRKGNNRMVLSGMDRKDFEWEERFEKDSAGRIIIMRDKVTSRPFMRRPGMFLGDSLFQEEFVIEHGPDNQQQVYIIKERGNRLPFAPDTPGISPLPDHRRILIPRRQNMIDLSAPEIISYKKRKLGGGREKITVIRKEVP
jgi:hypothetical protein